MQKNHIQSIKVFTEKKKKRLTKKGRRGERVMSAYFCPHLMFNFGYLIEFMCLKSDLIDNSDNKVV